MQLGLGLMHLNVASGGGFTPGTVPRVISSTIPSTGDGIMVVFDRPMHITSSLQDAMTIKVNGGAPVKADHVIISPDKKVIGMKFPANFFKIGDVVTWAYNDQHATEEIKGAETGGKEIDNQTYAVVNAIGPVTIPLDYDMTIDSYPDGSRYLVDKTSPQHHKATLYSGHGLQVSKGDTLDVPINPDTTHSHGSVTYFDYVTHKFKQNLNPAYGPELATGWQTWNWSDRDMVLITKDGTTVHYLAGDYPTFNSNIRDSYALLPLEAKTYRVVQKMSVNNFTQIFIDNVYNNITAANYPLTYEIGQKDITGLLEIIYTFTATDAGDMRFYLMSRAGSCAIGQEYEVTEFSIREVL